MGKRALISLCAAQNTETSRRAFFSRTASIVPAASSGELQSRLRWPSTTRASFPGSNCSITAAAAVFERWP